MGLIPLLASHYPMFKIVMGLLPVIEKALICLVPVSVAFDGLLRGSSGTGRGDSVINAMLFRLSVVVFSLYVGLLAGMPLCPALGLSNHAMAVLNATLPVVGYAAAISTVLFIPILFFYFIKVKITLSKMHRVRTNQFEQAAAIFQTKGKSAAVFKNTTNSADDLRSGARAACDSANL